jgi:glycosyltransferase involved in cell wall biosynthesis
MRICMVVTNMNNFGGLEEFAKNLAINIQNQGHQVSVLSTVWVPPDNQYLKSLLKHNITYTQLPKWISIINTDWTTKEKIVRIMLALSLPIIILLAIGLSILKKRKWDEAYLSARNWAQGQWMNRIIGPDRRKPYVRLLLNWWQFHWHPEIYHLHGYTSNLLFVIDWAHAKNIPVVYQEHQTPDAQFDWWKDFSKTINKASLIVAVSEKSAQALKDVCGVTQPIEVIYYMVEDPKTLGWSANITPRQKDDLIRVSTFARLYVTKGLPYLLDAIVQVKSVHPNTQFKVYGDGPLHDELMDCSKQLGLDGNEIFVGAFTGREELNKIMSETDIYVMSSILEGLPIAMIEAMSYGSPMVVTAVGGIPEAIQDSVNGMVCEPGDARCLAQKICRLIEDPELRIKLGQAARKSYEQGPFHPLSVSSQYISAYQKLLRARSN